MNQLTAQEAIIYIMLMTSAADSTLSEKELNTITQIVIHYPVFDGFDLQRLDGLAQDFFSYLDKTNGIDEVLQICHAALNEKLRNTAYAFAVEVCAVDLEVQQEELQFLQILRDSWELEDLTVAAIELSARVRLRKLT